MIKKSGYSKHSSKEVTEVICRNIAAGHEKDYDDWLERFMISERQFPGYLGTTIIAPGGNTSSCGGNCSSSGGIIISSLRHPIKIMLEIVAMTNNL